MFQRLLLIFAMVVHHYRSPFFFFGLDERRCVPAHLKPVTPLYFFSGARESLRPLKGIVSLSVSTGREAASAGKEGVGARAGWAVGRAGLWWGPKEMARTVAGEAIWIGEA
jgi:hypothetical protein